MIAAPRVGTLLRYGSCDSRLVAVSLLHGGAAMALLALASCLSWTIPLVVFCLALGMCWGSNTVSHIHLHTPIFRGRTANRAFSFYLSLLLGVPQIWWKRRHLVHHQPYLGPRDVNGSPEGGALLAAEVIALFAAMSLGAMIRPHFVVVVVFPALLIGYGLCAVQGWQEHSRCGAGVDHHGLLHNWLWFNDGYHAAHHRHPFAHWTSLPGASASTDVVSPYPPMVRWIEQLRALTNLLAARALDTLERLALGTPWMRTFLLRTHERAWQSLIAPSDRAALREVLIVGGGLFPRSALVLSRLLPHAHLTLLDAVPENLTVARRWTDGLHLSVTMRVGVFPLSDEAPFDLIVVPLAFRGDRSWLYKHPPAPRVAVHDWMGRVRGTRGVRISWLLFKRLNLIERESWTPESS